MNPAGSYIRSRNVHNQQCNVNISYKTVSPHIKGKREKLVTEIAGLLGTYAGHWFAPAFRPRNLPLHPLDWSTALLEELHSAAQSLPQHYTSDQRLTAIRDVMANAAHGSPQSDAAAQSAGEADATEAVGASNSADAGTSRKPTKQQLQDRIQGLTEELNSMKSGLHTANAKYNDKNEEWVEAHGRAAELEFLMFALHKLATGEPSAYSDEELWSEVFRIEKGMGFSLVPLFLPQGQ